VEKRDPPLVSVIIPTYNSQKNVKSCLESIINQTYKRIEILVVDRHSSDGTVQIARTLKAKVFQLKSERSEAKNYGARMASGDFLFFVDSDMMLTPRVIADCVNNCLAKGLDGIIVPEKSVGEGLLGQWRETEKHSGSNFARFTEIPRFVKKKNFVAIGGYDEKLVCGEDFDFFQRYQNHGNKIGKIDFQLLHVEGNPSLYSVLSKAYYYGKTIPALVKKSPTATVERYTYLRLASIKNAGTAIRSVGILGFAAAKLLENTAYFVGIFTRLISELCEKVGIKKLKSNVLENKIVLANIAVIVLIAIVIFRNFLFTDEWPGGGDVMGFISRAYLYGPDNKWLYMWRPYSFGFIEGINFMDFFLMLLYNFFRDPSWTVKVFMFLSYLVAAFSMYLFAYRYTHLHVATLAASMVYILNQWLFSQLTEAHVDILFSYALAPLMFLLLDKALQTGKPRDILLFSMGLSLFATSFHPECILIYGVFLATFAIFFVVFPTKTMTVKTRSIRLLKVIVPSAFVVLALSAFFLIPFFMNIRSPYFHPSYEYPLEDSLGGSYQNLTDAFTLRAVESWGYVKLVDVYSGLGFPDFPVYALLFIVFFLSYCLLLVRRDRYTVFFAVSMLISIFLAKGPHPPFGQFFIWSWFNISHFAIFRAANRWVMMAIFSNAFFISLLVSNLVAYIKRKDSVTPKEGFSLMGAKPNSSVNKQRLSVSTDIFNNLLSRLRRILYIASILLLAFIFLSGFLACSFFFSRGLQTYTPPQSYLAPYEWLSLQSDDYKIVSISRSPSEWENLPDALSDFGYNGMLTALGWTHDLGFDSSFLHGKPVLQDGGWDFQCHQFVDYLRFRLARDQLTSNLFKILGTFGYKYIVIPPYTTDDTRNFFLNQSGYRVLYDDGVVLQNQYAAPRIFALNQSIFVVGGLESFDMLCKFEDFDLNKNALFFASPSVNETSLGEETLNKCQMLCLTNLDVLDLAMIFLDTNGDVIHAGDYGAPSINTTSYWVKMPAWRRIGSFVLGGDTLTTFGNNRITIPFELSSDGYYDIWLRIGFASYRGKLSVTVDNQPVSEIHPEATLWSKLTWINITGLNLSAGKHSITFENDGTGYNDIDAITIVKPSDLESKINEAENIMQNFPGRILYLMEAENVFLGPSSNSWYWTVEPYNGFVARSDDMGLNVAPLASSNATSFADSLEASYANDGRSDTRWASEKYVLPQWLELSWNETQELRGVQIFFENAYATNYTVQTWNGEEWATQTEVVGNNQLEPTHRFAEPVKTNKLRVYITASSIYDRVSIWELEAYSTGTTSTPAKIMIPRSGKYMIAARVGTGPNYGTLYFKVNETYSSISCNDSLKQFEWCEIGPFNFEVGEQYLSVGGDGPIELDELLVYSLNDGESYLDTEELFNSSSPMVSVNYETINPCSYKVHVNADQPFDLIFSDTYDQLWKAYIGDEEVSSTSTYSLVNSFHINKTGQFDIDIYFTGQNYADLGIKISLISFFSISISAIALSIIFHKRKFKRRKLTGGLAI
jgi:glycosyltransferase involved in cell wall biosynthesis